MSQALIQFLTIAIAIAVVIVVALHILKANKALKEARKFNLKLQGQNAMLQVRIAGQKGAEYALQSEVNNLEREILTLVAFAADLLQEIEERKALPLRGLTDEELVEVIREELTHRVEHRCLVEYAFGPADDPIWKIASKVGGAAFRVVDKAKRGKLTVQS